MPEPRRRQRQVLWAAHSSSRSLISTLRGFGEDPLLWTYVGCVSSQMKTLPSCLARFLGGSERTDGGQCGLEEAVIGAVDMWVTRG